MDDDALLVKVAGSNKPLRLRRSGIERLEVSRGERSHAAKGALIGIVTLTIAGVTYGTVAMFSAGPGAFGAAAAVPYCGEKGLLMGVLIGIPVGAAIGGAIKTEPWEHVPLSVTVAPQPRGARAALTLRF